MGKTKKENEVPNREKEFLKLFDQLAYTQGKWQAWENLMTVMATSIANSAEFDKERRDRREKDYEQAIKSLGGMDVPAQMFAQTALALAENPDQDFLGTLYMRLNMGSHWHGQFFTPYHVSAMMAKMLIGGNNAKEIEEKGYISVCDPTVGAGAMLIGAASAFREQGIDYKQDVVFIGQDLDSVVAKMAYIQISLLGCSGYITVGNSLTNPQTGHVLFPTEEEGQDLWITPAFLSSAWEKRRRKVLLEERAEEGKKTA